MTCVQGEAGKEKQAWQSTVLSFRCGLFARFARSPPIRAEAKPSGRIPCIHCHLAAVYPPLAPACVMDTVASCFAVVARFDMPFMSRIRCHSLPPPTTRSHHRGSSDAFVTCGGSGLPGDFAARVRGRGGMRDRGCMEVFHDITCFPIGHGRNRGRREHDFAFRQGGGLGQ